MADIVDFPSTQRKELLVWQCNCGSRSFRLLSDRSAVCNICDFESAGVFGYWRIREITVDELQETADNVVALRPGAAAPSRAERALLDVAMEKPLVRGIVERGGAIVCCTERVGQGAPNS
jgi:hypothetical protein